MFSEYTNVLTVFKKHIFQNSLNIYCNEAGAKSYYGGEIVQRVPNLVPNCNVSGVLHIKIKWSSK